MQNSVALNEGVRVRLSPPCFLCGAQGRVAWSSLRDRLYSAPGAWQLRRCDRCAVMWLDPSPIADDLGLLYATYYTHGDGSTLPEWGRLKPWLNAYLASHYGYPVGSRSHGKWLRLIPLTDELMGGTVNWLAAVPGGRLLDVGCGNGELLRWMRKLGWTVTGVEPDGAAREQARSDYDLDVRASLDQVETAAFDAVTAHHVIEHVLDPIAFLRDLARLTRPDGRIVVVTPNVYGLGARAFGSSWVHLDPPRHVILFSARSLAEVARRAGLVLDQCKTTSRYARFAWAGSRSIAVGREHRAEPHKPQGLRRPISLVFQLAEHAVKTVWPTAGEEIVLVAHPAVEG